VFEDRIQMMAIPACHCLCLSVKSMGQPRQGRYRPPQISGPLLNGVPVGAFHS
jgi:hypothetical protein